MSDVTTTLSNRLSRRSWLRLTGIAASGALLAACAPSQQTSGQQAPAATKPTDAAKPAAASGAASSGKKTVTIAYTTDLEGWSPFSHSGSTQYARYLHFMDPLVWRDEKKDAWVPHIAESWKNIEGNTWEFKLRQGVKFHDGSDLTADDVVWSYNRMKTEKDSKQAPVIADVDEITAPDKYTVRIHTKNPDAAFVGRLDNRVIMSKAYHEKLGTEAADKQQIGTGPYKFKEWLPGQRLVLEKSTNYWGPFKPTWDEVVFRIIPEEEARITALTNGEVDVISNVSPQNHDRLNNSGSAKAVGVRGQRMLFVGLSPIVEPLKNEKVRQAINYAVDKEAIIKGILQGRAYVMEGPIGPGMYSYDEKLQPTYGFNLDKAKQLLTEAGYPNGFEVDFFTPSDRYIRDKDISTAIVGMLSKIGIKANLKTPEWATFSDEYNKGMYPMYLIGRGSVVDPSEYLHQYFRTGVTKRLQFSDPEVDAALRAEQREFDEAKRVELLRKAQSMIMQKAPVVFLLQYEDTYGAHKRVDFEPRSDEYIFGWEVKQK
jgi:peptide/nickel transport system substrate-binding protein